MEIKDKEGLINETANKILSILGLDKGQEDNIDKGVSVDADEETAGMTEAEIAAYNKAKQRYSTVSLKDKVAIANLSEINTEILNDMIDAGASQEKVEAYIAKLSIAPTPQPLPVIPTGGASPHVKVKEKQILSATDFGKMLHEKFGKKIYKGGI